MDISQGQFAIRQHASRVIVLANNMDVNACSTGAAFEGLSLVSSLVLFCNAAKHDIAYSQRLLEALFRSSCSIDFCSGDNCLHYTVTEGSEGDRIRQQNGYPLTVAPANQSLLWHVRLLQVSLVTIRHMTTCAVTVIAEVRSPLREFINIGALTLTSVILRECSSAGDW